MAIFPIIEMVLPAYPVQADKSKCVAGTDETMPASSEVPGPSSSAEPIAVVAGVNTWRPHYNYWQYCTNAWMDYRPLETFQPLSISVNSVAVSDIQSILFVSDVLDRVVRHYDKPIDQKGTGNVCHKGMPALIRGRYRAKACVIVLQRCDMRYEYKVRYLTMESRHL